VGKARRADNTEMQDERQIAVLFARQDSIYKSMAGCDVYDIDRDARSWSGGVPLVAHPPCRSWGRLRQFAKPREDEKALGPWAVEQVRKFGGVLEHPAESSLFIHCGMPRPGRFPDDFGGWSFQVDQFHWGHRAEKSTWLYVVGIRPDELPPMPVRAGAPTHCVRPTRAYPRLPSITKAEREHTPPDLARWLVAVARTCSVTRC
jgi:hypothetical protein